MTPSPLLIVLCICFTAGWLDLPAVKARRSSSLSYWTQKQPCHRMEWNELPDVTISARRLQVKGAASLVPDKSSSPKKVKDKHDDSQDDHHDLVVLGCVVPSSTLTASAATEVDVKTSNSNVGSNVTKKAVTAAAVVAANVTVSGSSQESESESTKLLSWLHSKGINKDLVRSVQSEISSSSAAGTTSGVAHTYSKSNIASNGTADTAISTDATPTLQRLVCLSFGLQAQQQSTVSRAADARKVWTKRT
jgi:hypothetical protein